MREIKRATAHRVLMYRVHVEGAPGPDSTFSSRETAGAEADRLRRSGLRVDVHPVHTPLPTNPWLCVHPPGPSASGRSGRFDPAGHRP